MQCGPIRHQIATTTGTASVEPLFTQSADQTLG